MVILFVIGIDVKIVSFLYRNFIFWFEIFSVLLLIISVKLLELFKFISLKCVNWNLFFFVDFDKFVGDELLFNVFVFLFLRLFVRNFFFVFKIVWNVIGFVDVKIILFFVYFLIFLFCSSIFYDRFVWIGM